MVKQCINDRFNIFLDKNYLKHRAGATEHTFYSKFIDTKILREHHIFFGRPDLANDLINREIFFHHNLCDDDMYAAYVRRCNRLLHLIDTNHKITFIYHNCYTIDLTDILDFYNNFSKNTNIYVVGIFENSCDRKMLFDSPNCKIYQNYDRDFIFSEHNIGAPEPKIDE